MSADQFVDIASAAARATNGSSTQDREGSHQECRRIAAASAKVTATEPTPPITMASRPAFRNNSYLPPVTSMNDPVVKDGSSESSQRMARATSSGVPPRFIGTDPLTRSTRFGSPPLACISV